MNGMESPDRAILTEAPPLNGVLTMSHRPIF